MSLVLGLTFSEMKMVMGSKQTLPPQRSFIHIRSIFGKVKWRSSGFSLQHKGKKSWNVESHSEMTKGHLRKTGRFWTAFSKWPEPGREAVDFCHSWTEKKRGSPYTTLIFAWRVQSSAQRFDQKKESLSFKCKKNSGKPPFECECVGTEKWRKHFVNLKFRSKEENT